MDRSLPVEKWDDSQEIAYRVRHGEKATYEGIIRKNPTDKREFVAVGFTGNSINPGHGGGHSQEGLGGEYQEASARPAFLFR